jgi:hypothetical protein
MVNGRIEGLLVVGEVGDLQLKKQKMIKEQRKVSFILILFIGCLTDGN